VLLFALCTFSATAQRIKGDDIEYSFTQLPLHPLEKAIKNYSVKILPAYEEKNKQLLADYTTAQKAAKEKYDKDLATYAVEVKTAEQQYEKELEEYNKKNTVTKILEKNVLGENTKPVKKIPSKPYLEEVPKPRLQTEYDYPVLASTYLKLDGYDTNPGGVQILVTLYGFDYTQPRIQSVQKDMVSVGKTTSTYKATYYYTEFSYRQPMAVKVIHPSGKELLNITPQELNVYKIYKSQQTETAPSLNTELLIKTHEEKLLQENLQAINKLVNDKFGFAKTPRKTTLYYVKAKGDEYNDLQTALNIASSALHKMNNDVTAAKTEMAKAVELWMTALKESDPSNKKARIDNDVTVAICFNLLEAQFALANEQEGVTLLQKLNSLELSKSDRKTKEEYELLFADLKKRKENNQNIL
jgi:hypothetical protein